MKVIVTEQQISDILKNYQSALGSMEDIDIEKEAPGLAKLGQYFGTNTDFKMPFTPQNIVKQAVKDKAKNFFMFGQTEMMHPLGPLGKNYPITSDFGKRISPYDPISGKYGSSQHQAVDISVPSGTAVYSPLDGVVVAAKDSTPNACGGMIQIDHGNLQTRYCHLSSINVQEGEKLKQGQIIGKTGGGKYDKMRGTSTNSHLHYAILNKSGIAINPTSVQKNLS